MSSEDKHYYTPEISEFHVGFRYEQKVEHDDPWKSYQHLDHDTVWRSDIKNKLVRVKYLDQSDIEELGWKYYANTDDIDGYYMDKDREIYRLTFSPKYLQITHKTGVATSDRLFKGQIKNYNELQRLMKQLNIL